MTVLRTLQDFSRSVERLYAASLWGLGALKSVRKLLWFGGGTTSVVPHVVEPTTGFSR